MSVDDQLERELQRRLANYNPDTSCPHCAAKDAEIAALRERMRRADNLLALIKGRSTWIGMHSDLGRAQTILRGEGE